MLVGTNLPDAFTGHHVHRMSPAAAVAEEGEPLAVRSFNANGTTNQVTCIVGPILATAGSIQRIEFVIVSAHEDPSSDDAHLSNGPHRTWKSESPFHFELWDISRGELRLRLKT